MENVITATCVERIVSSGFSSREHKILSFSSAVQSIIMAVMAATGWRSQPSALFYLP